MVTNRLVDSVVEFLAASSKPQDILAYKLPADLQERASYLLERNREGEITLEEKEELDQFVFLEHIFRMAKARARMQLAA